MHYGSPRPRANAPDILSRTIMHFECIMVRQDQDCTYIWEIRIWAHIHIFLLRFLSTFFINIFLSTIFCWHYALSILASNLLTSISHIEIPNFHSPVPFGDRILAGLLCVNFVLYPMVWTGPAFTIQPAIDGYFITAPILAAWIRCCKLIDLYNEINFRPNPHPFL